MGTANAIPVAMTSPLPPVCPTSSAVAASVPSLNAWPISRSAPAGVADGLPPSDPLQLTAIACGLPRDRMRGRTGIPAGLSETTQIQTRSGATGRTPSDTSGRYTPTRRCAGPSSSSTATSKTTSGSIMSKDAAIRVESPRRARGTDVHVHSTRTPAADRAIADDSGAAQPGPRNRHYPVPVHRTESTGNADRASRRGPSVPCGGSPRTAAWLPASRSLAPCCGQAEDKICPSSFRPRWSRDLTVPVGTCNRAEISSALRPTQ